MAYRFEANGWQEYLMTWHDPHRQLESPEREIAIVKDALDALVSCGVLPHNRYDKAKFEAHRAAVRERFDIPWTAITPRMQRLLYALNAVAQPSVLAAVGVFCGNTFVSSAGAAIGPGRTEARRAVRRGAPDVQPLRSVRPRRTRRANAARRLR